MTTCSRVHPADSLVGTIGIEQSILMQEEIGMNGDCQFYVATDSEEEKKRLKDIFGERILTLPRAADRNSITGMQDALVELYVLSHTRKILGSMQSSYSETAAQISNIHCELLTKKA